jgi:hypothetical protein
MTLKNLTVPALLAAFALVLAALMVVMQTSNTAAAGGYTTKNWDYEHLVHPTPITTTVTAATTTPVTGLRYGVVEAHASLNNGEAVATTTTLDYTIQFSNDGQNWSDAGGVQVNDSATPIPYTLEDTLTGGEPNGVLQSPMMGRYARIKWSSSGHITPSLSLLLKNTGGK